MSVATLDTLAVVKQLKAARFTDDQAEAVSRVVRESQNVDLSDLATKSDLAESRRATQSDLAELRQTLTAELAESRLATKADLADLRAELLEWMFGTIGFQTLAILGAIVTIARLGIR